MDRLRGSEKVAILMIALGQDVSAEIFKHLTEEEIEQITLEITNIRKVDSEVKQQVYSEFYDMYVAQSYISQGGIAYAKEVLEKAIGSQKAYEIIEKLSSTLQVRPFGFARKADPSQLFSLIQNEAPQTIAIIFSYLHPQQAGLLLGMLPKDKQITVIEKIATMDRTSPEYIKEIERIIERKMSASAMEDFTVTGGLQSVVDILNGVDRGTEKYILETLSKINSELADKIRKKMFVFEDIVKLDSRSVQKVISDTDVNTLAIALKGATQDVHKVIFDNISSRLRQIIQEDMEYMGPVRVRDVEEAQQKIVNVIRKLEEAGEIVIVRGKEDILID
ncbi:MAG: flagellar motor switch protein FliG [Clostridiaceae bacterium]|nr:flagellar motor switch protein FliG [Clostridiaceae bacterium]